MRLNRHIRDSSIVFDKDTHSYCVNGDLYRDSITSFVKTFFDDFNAQSVLDKNYDRWQEQGHRIYNFMTKEEILNYWSEKSRVALVLGDKLHNNIENFYNKQVYEKEFLAKSHFLSFEREHSQYNVYRTEWVIYDDYHKIAGTLDMLYEKNDKFYLYDWKRVRDIKRSKYFKKALHTIDHISDNNYWRYSLQLNMYRYILKLCYDIEVEGMFLVSFHEDNTEYKKIPVECLEKEINAMLQYRLKN